MEMELPETPFEDISNEKPTEQGDFWLKEIFNEVRVSNARLKTIENIMIFYLVTTIIGVVLVIISMISYSKLGN